LHKFSISLFIIFFAFFSQVQAKPIESKDKADKVSHYFMGQIFNGEVEAAYSLISAYVGVDFGQFIERGKKVASDIQQLEKSAGKPLSFDLLETQSVGEHFYKITYLMKYDTIALVWNINYYQPDKGWKLVDITFNGDINALFK
jgi:hypothetical protein